PDELPAEAVREREYYRRVAAPRSHLGIPLRVGQFMIGVLGVGDFLRERYWHDDLIQGLRMLGEIFANALARKRADLALRETETRFRLLGDFAPVMIWMSGPDKLCTYFNKPWLDFTGYPLEHEMGTGWSEGVHPDDRGRCLDTY